jgi:hypothetical protein
MYKKGSWNIICDVCGKKLKAYQTFRRWDGFIVCKEDYETRHPQDFVKARIDKQSVPFSRPESTDQFTNVSYIDNGDAPYCNLVSSTGAADICTAGCARADIPQLGL